MNEKRTATVLKMLKPAINAAVSKKFNFTFEPFTQDDGPYLILPTHAWTFDVFMVSQSFAHPLRFVASEHIFRSLSYAPLIKFIFDPIVKQKAQKDAAAALEILRALKRGEWVCLYPEGNCSHNGRTLYIADAIGKLMKSARVNVLLYVLEDGYLAAPRWAKNTRRGAVRGYVKRIISKEECAAMSAAQLTEIVRSGLFQDCAAGNTLPFKGRDLAECLERAMFICPKCGACASVTTAGDGGRCTECGWQFEYTETGHIAADGVAFDTVAGWDDWQREQVWRRDYSGDGLICADDGEHCQNTLKAKRDSSLGEGRLALYCDRLEFSGGGGFCWSLEDISGVSVVFAQNLEICAGGRFYEFSNPRPRSAIKYMYYINAAKRKRKGDTDDKFFGI